MTCKPCSPAFPSCPSIFATPSVPWTNPGNRATSEAAYGAICCHRFKPKNQTGGIFLAQILGHKLLARLVSIVQHFQGDLR
jgi:hypothetical protein